MALFEKKDATGKWWVDHSLSIVFVGLLIFQTVFLLFTGPQVFAAEGLSVPYWVWFSHEYMLSTVADTFGIVLIVILSKYLYERGSASSNKDPELKQQEEGKNGS